MRLKPAPGIAKPEFGPDKPWLAPLAGYSDLPLRMLCRSLGAACCETEMISAKGMMHDNTRTASLLQSHPGDQPLVVQLFGAEPEVMGAAAKLLRGFDYLHLDCNLGCSVRKVFRQGAGASLLDDPERALAIARNLISVARLDDGKPRGMVGFKLRLGVDASRPALPDLALRLEDAGADWLTVHPRFARDGFGGRARWEELGKLADRLTIPLIASGDLLTAEAGAACLKETGATGVMYARGALYNPAIFRQHFEALDMLPKSEFTKTDLAGLIATHISYSREFGDGLRSFKKMRSLLPRYIHKFPGVGALRQRLCQTATWEELSSVLASFFASEEGGVS